jgi:hypothetical protein
MKALIWKECHENLKWAVLAMLVAGGLMFLNLKERTPDTIMNAGFVAVTIVISAVFAAVLGFLQVFTESGGDRRSLLLHRPVSRSHIFLAKAAAGLGLYLLALGYPSRVPRPGRQRRVTSRRRSAGPWYCPDWPTSSPVSSTISPACSPPNGKPVGTAAAAWAWPPRSCVR